MGIVVSFALITTIVSTESTIHFPRTIDCKSLRSVGLVIRLSAQARRRSDNLRSLAGQSGINGKRSDLWLRTLQLTPKKEKSKTYQFSFFRRLAGHLFFFPRSATKIERVKSLERKLCRSDETHGTVCMPPRNAVNSDYVRGLEHQISHSTKNRVSRQSNNFTQHLSPTARMRTPVLVRSPRLNIIVPGQYLDGWPIGNTGCCWYFSLLLFFRTINFSFPSCRKASFCYRSPLNSWDISKPPSRQVPSRDYFKTKRSGREIRLREQLDVSVSW